MKLSKETEDVLDDLGWSVYYLDDGNVEIENQSPAGEDLIYVFSVDSFYDELKDLYNDFDCEEHVIELSNAKENGMQGVPSLSVLINDAARIESMLEELACAVGSVIDK